MNQDSGTKLDHIEKLLQEQLAAVVAADMNEVETLSASITEMASGFSETPPGSEERIARLNALNEQISLALSAAKDDVARELAGVRKARQLMSYKATGPTE